VVEIRPIGEDEFEAFIHVDTLGFSTTPRTHEQLKRFRTGFEFDRTAVAFDGPSMVGTSTSYSFELTVPGGALLSTGGLSWVSVVPTHRRQGLLTKMMRAQLDDCRDRGDAASALYASESAIYRRFGYEMSVPQERWQIERAHAQFAFELEAPGRLQLVSREEAVRRLPPLYERVRRQRPGMTSVAGHPWDSNGELFPPDTAEQRSKRLYVFYERDGSDDGFASYEASAQSNEPGDATPSRNLEVHDVLAASDEAHFAIWRYLLSVDLVARIDCYNSPPDDALIWMLADPRRLMRRTHDGLWLRLIDVPAALSARSYAADGAVTLEVNDAFCEWVSGRYRLEANAGEARCVRTDAAPDLVLDLATLSGAYLGGPGLATLARAGRVTERTAGALSLADRMFRGDRAPWHAFMF
jgi:predicted acetyltransferase